MSRHVRRRVPLRHDPWRAIALILGALAGSWVGAACWPFWWPEWTAWAFITVGATTGAMLTMLAHQRGVRR